MTTNWPRVKVTANFLLLRKPGLADKSCPCVRLGGLIRGKTCWRALEPDTWELCFRTSNWSRISCTRSWMLLKADFGRELLLCFTACDSRRQSREFLVSLPCPCPPVEVSSSRMLSERCRHWLSDCLTDSVTPSLFLYWLMIVRTSNLMNL